MRRRPPIEVRLVAEGTRVVVLVGGAPGVAGTISAVRPQTNLRSYEVTCDDGKVVFASGCDLALEHDAAASPIAPRVAR